MLENLSISSSVEDSLLECLRANILRRSSTFDFVSKRRSGKDLQFRKKSLLTTVLITDSWRPRLTGLVVTPTLPAPSGVPGSRKRPSLLSLACASGHLFFAVGERYYCVCFLSSISSHVRTYADASFHNTIQARSTNTRFT